MESNTRINYLYRDASNYKKHNEVIIRGVLTDQQIDIIMSCLEAGEYFIPEQVGLPEVRSDDSWTEDDHVWFELYRDGFEEVSMEPTVELTAAEVVERFLRVKENWKEEC